MGVPADADTRAPTTRAPSAFKLRYAPALDGVRALAIVLVALYNAETPGFWGGFVGVRLFFVLSGYLITSLLLERLLAEDTIRFGTFYVRRFERLFPPLLAVLLAFLALRVAIGGTALFEPSVYEVVFAASYIGNWTIVAFHSPDALGHTWSLAVEEQFYFLWPLLLWSAWRVARWRGLAALATVGMLAAATWRPLAVALVRDHPQPVQYLYYATDVCAFGFLAGAGVAIAAASRRGAALLQSAAARRWAPWATALALLALAFAAHRLSAQALSTYGVGLTAVELAGALLIAALLVPGAHPLRRLFEWPPAVWLGRLSYSLYLVHWPIVRALLETDLPAWQRIPLSAALSLGAAWLLYALVERRLLARSTRRGLARS